MFIDRMRHLRLVHSNTWTGCSSTHSPCVDDAPFDPAIQAMVEHVRMIMPLPRAVRARALARARATLAASASSTYQAAAAPSGDHHR
jgi:hypothetical protein